jgi:hypothetical protein
MIDHLIRYADEAAAIADPALAAYRHDNGWQLHRTFPDIKVYDTEAEDPTAPLPYWYILISLSEASPDLIALPYTMIVTDREATLAAGSPVVLHSAIPVEAWPRYRAEPMPAGSNYPFGQS